MLLDRLCTSNVYIRSRFFKSNNRKFGIRQIGVQEFDIVNMVKSSTKYAVIVKRPDDIKYHLEKAYIIFVQLVDQDLCGLIFQQICKMLK